MGGRNIDIFCDELPAEYDENKMSDSDGIHSYVVTQDEDGNDFYHLLLTPEQWTYFSLMTPQPKWLKTAMKASKKRLKKFKKKGAQSPEDSPRHVFGSSVYDPETGDVLYPDGRENIKGEPMVVTLPEEPEEP